MTIFLLLVILTTGCTGADKEMDKSRGNTSRSVDTLYTQQAAMNIYAYHPVEALQIIDSAVIVGNVSAVRGDILRMRVLAFSPMHDHIDSVLGGPKNVGLDSAQAIGERLLAHDSIKENLKNQLDVLEMLSYSARMQNDTVGWMQRSREFVDVCHQVGPEQWANALRAEAEIGAAMHCMGQHERGMAKLDSVINQLEASFIEEGHRGKFNELDALIIAIKRKIVILGFHDKYAETLPLARRIIELLDDYEAHPDAYHDGTYREPTTDQKRADYIHFYRSQAQNFVTAAYVSLGEESNMIEAFKKIERGVRESTVREHIARYNALQMQMEAERQRAIILRANMTIVFIGIFALLFLALAVVFILKNRDINRKNRVLAQRITDAINYKKMYWKEKRAQAPTADIDTDTLTDEQFFQYINEVIVREQLYLDPKFERQTIMDRFQLSKERVGAIFSKGSEHAKMNSYILQLRLEYAAKLLVEQPDKSIVQVAAESGFGSHTYFSGCFRQHFGLSPTDFRKDALLRGEENIVS